MLPKRQFALYRPSMVSINQYPRFSQPLSIEADDRPKLNSHSYLKIPECDFLYESPNNNVVECPKVTVSISQTGYEPVEFDTELGEPQKKSLPTYYYQASQRVGQSASRSRSKSRRANSAQTPVTSRKAFASPLNNQPIYFPEQEPQRHLLNDADSEVSLRGVSPVDIRIAINVG